MTKILRYLREVRTELVKVIWPSRRETLKITLIVVVFSAAVALFLGAVDFGLVKLVELIFALK